MCGYIKMEDAHLEQSENDSDGKGKKDLAAYSSHGATATWGMRGRLSGVGFSEKFCKITNRILISSYLDW